ncbi:MAG TPA: CHAT domain-containing tetratricopeptide repeat protein [Bryobacteraceae bacterium]|nr:CHAT domain-containing tetratricopeptide repeat protein [Bryobacteraceae bacterium]
MKLASIALLLAAGAMFVEGQKLDWDGLDNQVEQLYLKGDMDGALRVAKLALEAASNPKQTGRSLDRIGVVYYNLGNLKDGEKFLRQSLDLRRERLGADSDDYAQSANDLALLLRDSRRFTDAQPLAEEAVAVRSRLLPNDPALAETLETLGTIYSGQGEYEKCAAMLERARAIYQSHIDAQNPAPPDYGTLLIDLGGNYQRLGKYQKAKSDFYDGLDVLRKTVGSKHPIYAVSLLGPASLESELGNYTVSEKLYSEAAPLLKSVLGETHPMYVQMLDNRAVQYEAMGNRAAAESDYRTALELRKKIFGPSNLTVAGSLRNYGRFLYAQNPDEGEKLLREGVAVYANSPDRPSFEYANTLLPLGSAERRRGDLVAARETLEKALEVSAKGLGMNHPVYARALASLALVQQASHEYAEAEQGLQQAIAIVKESQGDDHQDLALYLKNLAGVYETQGKYADALPIYRQSFEIDDRVLNTILNIGSESTKAGVLANLDDPLPALLEFQQKAGDQFPEARVLAFEAVARRKGRVLDHVRDWRQNLRASESGAVRQRLNQWQALIECQSSLTTALGYRDLKPAVIGTCDLEDPAIEVRYDRLLSDLRTKWTPALNKQALVAVHDLKVRTDSVETVLSRDVPGFSDASKPARLDDMRAHLAPDELLVEIAAYEKHYGAFLLDHSGGLRWVDLGPSRPIDAAVRDLIAGANDWSVSLSRHETQSASAAQATAQEALETISQALAPLRLQLDRDKPVHRLRIAPDGLLTLFPFAALATTPHHFLIERFAISYLSAGRDLIAPAQAAESNGPPVIALSPGGDSKQQIATAFRSDRLERLDGAPSEARSLQAVLPRSQLLAEGQATEQRVKELHSPALLHIVGHGLVRGNEDCLTNPNCELSGLDPGARAMSLSAIVLEEAYGRGGSSPQDGLLTALELESIDLQGSEMLVLSQCRMAAGVPSSSDGVYGMRRAATIAGVKTFVAPLWNVSDSTERALMERFYKELRSGKDRAEALRQAMLQVMRPRAAEANTFLYWAPVILSGDPSPLPQRLFSPVP